MKKLSEEDELTILKYWRDNLGAFPEIPPQLKDRMNEEQKTNLILEYHSESEDYNRVKLNNRIKEIEDKFKEKKEKSIFGRVKNYLKEGIAKIISGLILGGIIGFLIGKGFCIQVK